MRVFVWFPEEEQKIKIPGKNGKALYLEINSEAKDLLIGTLIVFYTRRGNKGSKIVFKIKDEPTYDSGTSRLFFRVVLDENEATTKQIEFFFRKWKYTPREFDQRVRR
ncbi:MAG: hypothetical protein WC414_02970 [Patescibacteria group bacterium]